MSLGWVWSIPVFGLLVFIHELGHFGVAKFFDIRVHEFALGFGPLVLSFKRGETRYSIRAIPLGGFVRMAGMEEGDMEDPRGFNRKGIMARALTIAAGPIMNFLLAIVLYAIFFGVQGDATIPVVEQVVAGTPAAAAGFQSGDRIVQIDNTPITHWSQLMERVRASDGRPLVFEVERDGATQRLEVTPAPTGEQQQPFRVGISPIRTPLPAGQAFLVGAKQTWFLSVTWFSAIGQMVIGRMKPELSGPLGIAQVISEQASLGFLPLLGLSGFLSINLGMFNLLPIPALDGSRLLFLLVEGVRGRRIDPHRENMVHFVGIVLLLGLTVWVTYQDFIRHVFQ